MNIFSQTAWGGALRTVLLIAGLSGIGMAVATAMSPSAAPTRPTPSAMTGPSEVGAEPVLRGDVMAHSCAACHGTYGQLGDEAFMPLAGMPIEQFVRTMRDFREGKRPSTLMGHVARGFNDAELLAMAEFFAAQKSLQGGQP
ncbi:MAG: cytochrome c class I [Tepidimonas sp.]|uniref:c-type cytochrome n=1 Tax=Tepidimonas sp. TaxID=2002775 RepID=UPI00259DD195|nr:cytochrome c class I [Tepidimonas sp.]MDM7456679.1 cytochrome c class I [Tepidimonas sp.]